MRDIILWLFNRIVDVIQFSLNFKVYGEFSLFHFVLGFNLLIVLFSFYKFGAEDEVPRSINFGLNSFRNYENKKERDSYKQYKKNRDRQEEYSRRYDKEKRGH